MKTKKNLLGPLLRKVRLDLEPPLSAAELSEKVGAMGLPLSQAQIRAIENQTRQLFDYEMTALIEVLKVPPQVLDGFVASTWAPHEENTD